MGKERREKIEMEEREITELANMKIVALVFSCYLSERERGREGGNKKERMRETYIANEKERERERERYAIIYRDSSVNLIRY